MMNRSNCSLLLLGLGLGFGLGLGVQAGPMRTQTIALSEGWNAVYLEVTPTNTLPAEVFAHLPVDIVASFYATGSSAQFVSDPGTDLFKAAGWGVWYAESRPDAFLKTLHSIYGRQPYLIHARSAVTWQVEGEVEKSVVRWNPNAYNLVGFAVHAQAGPTFAQFFGGSTAHRLGRLYRLTNGSWRRVLNPDAEQMKSGEAFWIYCDGGSKFQGPIAAETRTRHGLLLESGEQSLVLRNQADFPMTATLEHVVSGAHPVPLAFVIQTADQENESFRTVSAIKPSGAWTQPLPPIEAGGALRVPLEARLEAMTQPQQSSLLKVSTDLGTEIWIPVRSFRSDLKDQ